MNGTLPLKVADQLARLITSGAFSADMVLPNQDELCSSLQVSRTVLREAVQVLVAKGMIEVRPRTGMRILPERSWRLLDGDIVAWRSSANFESRSRFINELIDFRILIEPRAAGMAALRATPEQLGPIRRSFEGMAAAANAGPGETSAYLKNDLDFHREILRTCDNSFIEQMSSVIETALSTSFSITTQQPSAQKDSIPFHLAVLEALEARNSAAAEAAMFCVIDRAATDIKRELLGHEQ